MRKIYTYFLTALSLIVMSFTAMNKATAQSKVVIPGTFQSELGCTSDWDAACSNTALTYNSSTGLWAGTFKIPAGCHQYKVAIDGSWSINYGENGLQGGANIPLYVPAETMITFTYYPWSHIVETSPIASGFSPNCLPLVVLAGSMQSELGCAGDWDASCTNTALIYNGSSGLFEGDFMVPAGCYEYRVVLNNDWVNNFGRYGSPFDPNYILSVPSKTTLVHFAYNPVNHVVTSPYNNFICLPNVVTLAGSFQSELGCKEDWMADCNYTQLIYSPKSGLYEGHFFIPKGCYEYRVVLNNNWATNYGKWGSPSGPNYILSLPVKSDSVHFTFDPYSNLVNSTYNSNVCQPNTVVIAGSFQSELGCSGDWQPDCDKSRLEYDPSSGTWVDTFSIPAGKWEYKITIDNSWAENYGLYGIRGGENIPLELCYPAKVVFHYYHEYHWSYTEVITNGICLTKFYDPNTNNYYDEGELPMEGVTFTLTGNGITRVQTTDNEGKTAFTDLPNGQYLVKETVPPGYYSSLQDSGFVYINNGMATIYFGNVCLGPGGAKDMGYWISKKGEAALNDLGMMELALIELGQLNLRDATGNNFDPLTFEQFRTWLKGANSKNMVYMLSAQLAVAWLNEYMGYTEGKNRFNYIGTCGFPYAKFMNLTAIIYVTNFYLGLYNSATAHDPNRSLFECMKSILENANSNLNFVQLTPCDGIPVTNAKQAIDVTDDRPDMSPKLWPNPSNNYFTLRPVNNGSSEVVLLKVYNVNGQQIYTAKGSSNKDYRFGERFTPGMYMVEIIQGNNRTTFKLVKQ